MNKFLPTLLLATLALAACFDAVRDGHEHIPTSLVIPDLSSSPVIDGAIGNEEWRGASVVRLENGVRLLVGACSGALFIAIDSRTSGDRYADIFVTDKDASILNFHPSMRLGERNIRGSDWDDSTPPMKWDAPTGWRASIVRRSSDDDDDAAFSDYDGVEFRFARSIASSRGTRIRIESRDFFGGLPDVVFPKGSNRDEISGWATAELAETPALSASNAKNPCDEAIAAALPQPTTS